MREITAFDRVELLEPVRASRLGRRDDSTGLLGTVSVGIVAQSLRLSVPAVEECGLAGASTGELAVQAADGSFHFGRRPLEAGVGRPRGRRGRRRHRGPGSAPQP